MLLLSILSLLFLIQILFWFLYAFKQDMLQEHNVSIVDHVPLSVLVCAKNEAENLRNFLPLILAQDYENADWELVVVNDGATDDSLIVLNELAEKYSRIKILNIDATVPKTLPGKKYALLEGLKVCKYEVVLLTDADCYPATKHWIRSMVDTYCQKKQNATSAHGIFVLGYGDYKRQAGLLNWFVRWETLHTFMQYASWAYIGKPYMGVGRNLLYEKSPVLNLFHNHKFLDLFSRTASGDDDLIVAALANKENVAVAFHPHTHTVSIAPSDWQTWWRQKTRHVSSGKHYAAIVKNGLGAYALSGFLFWIISGLVLVSSSVQIQLLTLILIVLKILLYTFNFNRWNKVLSTNFIAFGYIFGEWLWLIYNFAISPFIFWKNKQQWK